MNERVRTRASGADAELDMQQIRELALEFESLGDNCEFGIMQRQAGAEPMSLLRFSYTPFYSLILALESQFDGVGAEDDIEIHVELDEYMINLRSYGFRYRTHRYVHELSKAEMLANEIVRLKYLRNKMIEDLTIGDKIYVRKGDPKPLARERMASLLSRIRRYGSARLLYVSEADPENLSGSLRVYDNGLMHGYVDAFAPLGDDNSSSFTDWIGLLGTALRARAANSAPGAVLQPRAFSVLNNPDERLSTLSTRLFPECLLPFGPRVSVTFNSYSHASERSVVHLASVEVEIDSESCLCTFSVWLMIPHGHRFRWIDPRVEGHNSRRVRRGDPERTGVWQRLEVTAECPVGRRTLNFVVGMTGDERARLYLCAVRMEKGLFVTPERFDRPAFVDGGRTRASTDQFILSSAEEDGRSVVAHRLLIDTGVKNGAVFRVVSASRPEAAGEVTVRGEVMILENFVGREVSLRIEGFDSRGQTHANVDRRGRWQNVEVSARLPDGATVIQPSLFILAERGSMVITRNWEISFFAATEADDSWSVIAPPGLPEIEFR